MVGDRVSATNGKYASLPQSNAARWRRAGVCYEGVPQYTLIYSTRIKGLQHICFPQGSVCQRLVVDVPPVTQRHDSTTQRFNMTIEIPKVLVRFKRQSLWHRSSASTHALRCLLLERGCRRWRFQCRRTLSSSPVTQRAHSRAVPCWRDGGSA